jgi:Protein of unknown function (DUF1592)/Protein of unknown function (DUF1588)/Protein of unknown function (DUF1595)/Protein of unknown function (DUF1587)/Protein of unknown function (DUF1585)
MTHERVSWARALVKQLRFLPIMQPVLKSLLPLGSALVIVGLGCTGVVGDGGMQPPGGSAGPAPTDPGIIGTGPGTGPNALTCTPANPTATTRLFRLTHAQYENSVRAVTGLEVQASVDFPADQNQAGFDRGMDLQVGDALGKAYRATAETIAAKVISTSAAYKKVVACDPAAGDACARTFVADFGRRVYRRPLTEGEKTAYSSLFTQGATLVDGTGTPFQNGVQTVVQAFLQSPHFLYRTELSTTLSGGLVTLSGFEIASRLSFLLQNGPPDDALLAAAQSGQLSTTEGTANQARRLVATEAARNTVRDFHHQWLIMDAFANKLTKDPTRYPTVTPDLAPVLVAETEQFVNSVTFDLGKGFTSLMTAPFTFVNKTTAPLYGVTGTFTDTLQRVDLDPTQRAGLFTRLGFLAANAYSNRSSPIHRGAFIQRHVLCATIPDPPPNVPQLPPLAATQTTRQQVDMHTAPMECAGCHHTLINPVGFGFENYDAVGQYRTTENGVTIDATGKLAGTAAAAAGNASFTDAVSESQLIASSPEGRSCYAINWVRYAFGRQESPGDSCAVAALAANLLDDNYKVTDLLVDMTRTKPFMFRAPGGP